MGSIPPLKCGFSCLKCGLLLGMSSVLVNVVVVASQIFLNPKQKDFFNVIIPVLEIGVSEKCFL